MREKPILMSTPMVRAILDGRKTETRRIIKPQPVSGKKYVNHRISTIEWVEGLPRCPYSVDRLWVKETFALSGGIGVKGSETVHYRANEDLGFMSIWKPSIFMPRWASRITLKVLGVHVERLHEIDNIGASAEGTPDLRTMENGWDMRRCYLELWEQINGPGSWLANPWVWVVKFERVQP